MRKGKAGGMKMALNVFEGDWRVYTLSNRKQNILACDLKVFY